MNDAPNPTGDCPVEFVFYIGGFIGRSCLLELKHGSVYVEIATGYEASSRSIVKVASEDWRAFMIELDDIGAWDWRRSYSTDGVLDGTRWSLSIRTADQSIISSGVNGYPGEGGMPGNDARTTPTFDRLLATVSKLVGQEIE